MIGSLLGTRGGRIVAAVSSAVATRLLSSLVAMISLPLAVRYLGAERFGVWATIGSTVVIFNLLDLGVASTLTNHIARSHAMGRPDDAARFVTNALALSSAIAATVGSGLAVVWPLLDWAKLLHVSSAIPPEEVCRTAAVALTLILLGLPASLVSRILAGCQEVHRHSLVVGISTVLNLVGLAAGVTWHASMPVLFALATGWTAAINLAALAFILLWDKSWLRPRLARLRWNTARELLSSGSGFFLVQIAGAVVFSSDNVVLSHYLGPAQVTPYSVTWRIVGLTALAQGLLFPALWPAYADAYARGEYAWMRRTFRRTMHATVALNVAFALVLLTIGQTLIRIWAGPAAVPPKTLLAAMALWSVISGAMTAESCLLAAVNRTREQGVLSIVAAALNLVLSVVLVQRIGAVGVMAGTILSYLIVLVVPQSVLVRSVLPAEPDENRVGCSRKPVVTCQ